MKNKVGWTAQYKMRIRHETHLLSECHRRKKKSVKIQPSCSVLLKIKQEEKEPHGRVAVARLHGTRIKRTWGLASPTRRYIHSFFSNER